jgi:hypothetical protein
MVLPSAIRYYGKPILPCRFDQRLYVVVVFQLILPFLTYDRSGDEYNYRCGRVVLHTAPSYHSAS